MIRLSEAQNRSFQDQHDKVMVSDTYQYLKEVLDQETTIYSDDELHHLSKLSYQKGRALGLVWKDKLLLFAFLVAETGGHALNSPEIEQVLKEPGVNPHAALDEIFNIIKLCNEVGS